MQSEALVTGSSALPLRAGIALLTLQLRASLQDAAAAEADENTADHDAAREQLRARLAPLMEERRSALDEALAQARAEAAGAVAAAHRAASVMVAQAPPPVEQVAPSDAEAVAAVVPVAEIVARLAEDVAPTERVMRILTEVVTSVAEVPTRPTTAAADEKSTQPGQPGRAQLAPTTTTVVIDAEAFARVFATVFAALLDERFSAWGAVMPARPTPGQALVPARVKQSFWTQARHPDVLLMGLAMVIVLVVLAAWFA